MRILLSNDDGIQAPGLNTLAKVLGQSGKHDVYVCAPDRQRSATGHSLTLHKPLRVQPVDLGSEVKGAWATTGTPADCVKIAISELMGTAPDVVISGINSGPNLGTDVLYSGTVAAAMEGAFSELPSIAVSAYKGEQAVFTTGAEFILHFLESYSDLPKTKRGLININIPVMAVKGVKICKLGVRKYHDTFERRSDPMGRDYYWLSGHAIEDGEATDSDVFAVASGYISVTPILFNMTDGELLKTLEKSPIAHLAG